MPESDQTDTNSTQPGQVVVPGASPENPRLSAAETAQASPAVVAASDESTAESGAPEPDYAGVESSDEAISWTASEFVAHQKSAGWYGGLVVVTLIIAALIYLVNRDIISIVVVIFGAVVFGVYAGRQPRQLEYKLDGSGVTIARNHHSYQSFRSFSVVPEGAFSSIVFMPLKRFAPIITIYYAPEQENEIVDLLSNQLPFEEYRHDVVDRLMKRIRF